PASGTESPALSSSCSHERTTTRSRGIQRKPRARRVNGPGRLLRLTGAVSVRRLWAALGLPESVLNPIPLLQVLEGLLRSLELVDHPIRRPGGHAPLAGAAPDDLSVHHLRRLALLLRRGALLRRRTRGLGT